MPTLGYLLTVIYPPRAYSEALYARGQSLSSCVQTLGKNDLVHIVDGYMHEVVLNPRALCKSSCVYPLPIVGTLHYNVVILCCSNVAGTSFSQRCENNLLTTLYNVVFTLCVCWDDP